MSRALSTTTSGSPPPAHVLRCFAVWVGVTALAVLGAAVCLETAGAIWAADVRAAGSTTSPDAGILLVAAAVGALACSWVWVVATSTVIDHLRGRQLRRTGVVRRLVLGACGVAVTFSALPAHAEVAGPEHSGTDVLNGLPFPDRATDGSAPAHRQAPRTPTPPQPAPPQPAPPPASPRPAQVAEPTTGSKTEPVSDPSTASTVHVVRPGDSLWRIAATHSPASSDGGDIQARAQALYEENRDVIGAEPDLIHPGQELTLSALDRDAEDRDAGDSNTGDRDTGDRASTEADR